MNLTGPRRQRWDVGEYTRLAELGFFTGRRVELIHGEIIQMPPMRNDHAVALSLSEDQLRRIFVSGYWIRPQMPLYLARRSAPEPDLAVVTGSPRDYQVHPRTALLVLEISDTTLAFDRARKAALYAHAQIPEYWIVNLVDRHLEVYRQPYKNRARPRRSCYQTITVHEPSDQVSPLACPNATIMVADLFP